jgi:hypothetical protein
MHTTQALGCCSGFGDIVVTQLSLKRFIIIITRHRDFTAALLLQTAARCRISRANLLARKRASAAAVIQRATSCCRCRREVSIASIACVIPPLKTKPIVCIKPLKQNQSCALNHQQIHPTFAAAFVGASSSGVAWILAEEIVSGWGEETFCARKKAVCKYPLPELGFALDDGCYEDIRPENDEGGSDAEAAGLGFGVWGLGFGVWV